MKELKIYEFQAKQIEDLENVNLNFGKKEETEGLKESKSEKTKRKNKNIGDW